MSDTDRLPAAQPGRAYVIVEPVANHYRLGKRTAGALQGQLEDLRVGCLNGANLYHAQKRPNPTSALESQPGGGRGHACLGSEIWICLTLFRFGACNTRRGREVAPNIGEVKIGT